MSIEISGRHLVIVFLISLMLCIGIGYAWLYLMTDGRIFSYADPETERYTGLVILFAGFMFLTPSVILTLMLYGIFRILFREHES